LQGKRSKVMTGKHLARRRRRSFTIVELLIVVAVLAVLAGLISAAAYRVIVTAVNTKMFVELGSLDLACRAFKEKFGDYPPDGTNTSLYTQFLNKAFPLRSSTAQPASTLNPCTALAFWLGGVPDSTGKPMGFSADPRNPFDAISPSRILPFFEFDTNRLSGNLYVPDNGSKTRSDPYIYFRALPGGGYDPTSNCTAPNGNLMRPCFDMVRGGAQYNAYTNPNSFQIRSPGRDGKLGRGTAYPYGIISGSSSGTQQVVSYSAEDYDDQANYCPKLTLMGAM
jgi:prepilin-type N-terminal cleavage/methylation domain-containing protein